MSNITKKAIKTAFKELIKTKSINDITINDITSYCGLNRQTFYYHFTDIFNLIEYIFLDDLDSYIGENKTYQTWEEGYKSLFNYCLDNKDFIYYTYNSISRKQVEHFLYNIAYDFLYKVIKELSKSLTIREEDVIYVTDFYKYVFVGLLTSWIDTNFKEDPNLIISKLDTLIKGRVILDLKRFAYNN